MYNIYLKQSIISLSSLYILYFLCGLLNCKCHHVLGLPFFTDRLVESKVGDSFSFNFVLSLSLFQMYMIPKHIHVYIIYIHSQIHIRLK